MQSFSRPGCLSPWVEELRLSCSRSDREEGSKQLRRSLLVGLSTSIGTSSRTYQGKSAQIAQNLAPQKKLEGGVH